VLSDYVPPSHLVTTAPPAQPHPRFHPPGYFDRQVSGPRRACHWSPGAGILVRFLVNYKTLPRFFLSAGSNGFYVLRFGSTDSKNKFCVSFVPQTQSSDFENYREDQGAFGGLFVDVAF
jgi:hypothetical protein